MPIIHPTCFNREGNCFHWYQDRVEENPILMSGESISTLMEFTPCNIVSPATAAGCGNPWNRLSKEYAAEIQLTKPAVVQPPGHGRRPATSIAIFNKGKVEIELLDGIGSDCWAVYSRKPDTHEVVETFYFLPHCDDGDRDNEEETAEEAVEQAKREALTADRLVDVLDQGLELCLSFGGRPFLDKYYARLLEDRYLEISV